MILLLLSNLNFRPLAYISTCNMICETRCANGLFFSFSPFSRVFLGRQKRSGVNPSRDSYRFIHSTQ